MSHKRGLLLINLGSPKACTLKDVQIYLKEFLMDPDVITLPHLLRYLLVNGLIIPRRAKQSFHAYKSIWNNGSPLVQYTHMLADELKPVLGAKWVVDYAMRYQYPSIKEGLNRLKDAGVAELFVLPLYPQSAAAVTDSVVKEVYRCLSGMNYPFKLTILPEFYNKPFFIDALSDVTQPILLKEPVDHLLMSYHGLPEKAVTKQGCKTKGRCRNCPTDQDSLQHCYRAQCFETSRLLATSLNLSSDQWSISFQSRLGRLPWVGPATDAHLDTLWEQGVRRLGVICPSFVADCLETLEEINIRAREAWEHKGGTFVMIPCLNAHRSWVSNLASEMLACSR